MGVAIISRKDYPSFQFKIMACNKALLFTLAFISGVFIAPPEAEAGCGESNARAYSINLSTQAKSPFDHGVVTECGNKGGSFESFKGKKLSFGWANCIENCEKGFKPAEIYVRVGNSFKPGSHKRDGWKKTCVQQLGSATMYCHEKL